MRKHGGTPSRRDKHVTLAANSPPGVARGRFVGGQQSGLAGSKPPPLFTCGASSCSSQGPRQGEPGGASPRPSAPTYLPPPYSPWGRPALPWNGPCGSSQPRLGCPLLDNESTSDLDVDPSASSMQSPGCSSTSHTPKVGRRILRRTHRVPDLVLTNQWPLGSPLLA